MKTQVEFRSNAFPPYEGEEEEINPGRYGKRLAEFLQTGLPAHGFEPIDVVPEDWGWVVRIKNEGFGLWVGCGNYEEYPEDGFLCFIEPHQPQIRRLLFLTTDTTTTVTALQEAINELLSSNPSIHDIKWWTYEEFNQPGR